ncbi:MAG: vitamin K epoxide reductase family protein [Minisyncoccia bacterium]
MKRIGIVGILILAFLGLADSAYLAQNAAGNTPLFCNIQNLSGCNTVAASQYSNLFGIPLAEFGVIFYVILFLCAALELALFNRFLRRILQGISLIGMLVSLYSIYIQMFVIRAFCIYCLASAGITFFVLILASLIEPLRKNGEGNLSANTPPSPQYLPMPPVS